MREAEPKFGASTHKYKRFKTHHSLTFHWESVPFLWHYRVQYSDYKTSSALPLLLQVGEGEFLDRWEPGRPLGRRQAFVLQMLRQALEGLAFMHGQQRLHQSVGPSSLVLNLTDER